MVKLNKSSYDHSVYTTQPSSVVHTDNEIKGYYSAVGKKKRTIHSVKPRIIISCKRQQTITTEQNKLLDKTEITQSGKYTIWQWKQ